MARIGEMRCINPLCSCTDVAVNETAGGNLSATCHKCGAPTFAKKGTRWRRELEANLLRRDPDDTGAPPAGGSEKDTSTPPAPAPAPARKSVGLML